MPASIVLLLRLFWHFRLQWHLLRDVSRCLFSHAHRLLSPAAYRSGSIGRGWAVEDHSVYLCVEFPVEQRSGVAFALKLSPNSKQQSAVMCLETEPISDVVGVAHRSSVVGLETDDRIGRTAEVNLLLNCQVRGCDLLSAPEKQRFSGSEAALGVRSVPEL